MGPGRGRGSPVSSPAPPAVTRIVPAELPSSRPMQPAPSYLVYTSFGMIFEVIVGLANARILSPCCGEPMTLALAPPAGDRAHCSLCSGASPYPEAFALSAAIEWEAGPLAAAPEYHLDTLTATLVSEAVVTLARHLALMPLPAVALKSSSVWRKRRALRRALRPFEGWEL